MHLEMEELNDFFEMFKGKEAETPVFIGQMNYHSETSMSVDVVLTTRYVDDGEVTIISYKEAVGVAEIPQPISRIPETIEKFKEQQEKFETQEKALGNLDVLAEAKKKEMIEKIKLRGFTTYRGIWTNES